MKLRSTSGQVSLKKFLRECRINGLQTAASVRPAEARAVSFGRFTFDRASRLLWKDDAELPLPPRVLGVLALLLEKPGELVTKQELMNAVWRDAFVTETSLAEAVSVLRQTLGDDPQRPAFIQTLHRRGYRFVAAVHDASAPAAVRTPPAAREIRPAEADPRLGRLVPWLVTLFAILTAASAVWRYLNTALPAPREPVRFALSLPEGVTVAASGGPVAVSSDGALVAVAGCKASDCGIYVRPLSQAEATLVAGTAAGAAPFFSPDGRSLGYFANARLYRIVLSGGSPRVVADAPEPLGAAWLGDDRIVFARRAGEGLFLARADGTIQTLTTPSPGDGGHAWPAAASDEAAIVFTVGAARPYAGVLSMRTRTWGRLLDDATAVRVPVPGYLLAQRGNTLLGSAIERGAVSIRGLPVPVAALDGNPSSPHFAMSPAGTLAIARAGSATVDVVLDWAGELRRLVPPPQPALPR